MTRALGFFAHNPTPPVKSHRSKQPRPSSAALRRAGLTDLRVSPETPPRQAAGASVSLTARPSTPDPSQIDSRPSAFYDGGMLTSTSAPSSSSPLRRWLPLACLGSLTSCGMIPHEEHDWRAEPHHLSVLMAGTFEEEEEAPSIGIDYEYRTSEFLGLGAVAEYAFEDIDATTFLAVADLHFTDQMILQTGPGVEFIGDETEAVFRIGCLHEWVVGAWTVSPQLHYDITSGENAVIFGIAFGVAF